MIDTLKENLLYSDNIHLCIIGNCFKMSILYIEMGI